MPATSDILPPSSFASFWLTISVLLKLESRVYEPLSRLLCEVLRRKGNRCFAIRSKTSAEQFLRRVRPDLVVLDYRLIGGVGLQAAQIASQKKVPVIITSGNGEIFERVHQAGYFYLMKPFTIAELLDMASVALGQEMGSFGYPSIQLH
jgi:DNA-binding response OmpR family regulator